MLSNAVLASRSQTNTVYLLYFIRSITSHTLGYMHHSLFIYHRLTNSTQIWSIYYSILSVFVPTKYGALVNTHSLYNQIRSISKCNLCLPIIPTNDHCTNQIWSVSKLIFFLHDHQPASTIFFFFGCATIPKLAIARDVIVLSFMIITAIPTTYRNDELIVHPC